MKKNLFRFVITILVVLTSVIMIDFLVGKILDSALSKISNQGDTGKTYFSLNEVNTPAIIVGSSRASHHYVTQMVEDSIGIPTYNIGRDGCYFSYNCCVINSILDRYNPKIIIWENGTEYLFKSVSDPLVNLYPYYGQNKWVTSATKEELPWTEYIKLSSRMYQYNSVIHRILMRYFGRNSYVDKTNKGYAPLQPKHLIKALELKQNKHEYTELSKTKTERFCAILKRAKEKGIKVIVVDSPMYRLCNINNKSAIEMQNICNNYGALFINNTQLPEFINHPEYFYDATHLNTIGAAKYTEFVLGQIKDFAII